MQNLVIAGLDPAIQSLDQSVKDWMPGSKPAPDAIGGPGMTWVGAGAIWLQRRHTPMSLDFLITSMVVILIPGTGVIYTLATGLGAGRTVSIAAAFGCTLGILPHIAAAMFGLAATAFASFGVRLALSDNH